MPFLQILGAIVGKPGSSPAILPNQNLKREIDGDAGSGEHHRSAALGTAKD
jgi:hypothetical protein